MKPIEKALAIVLGKIRFYGKDEIKRDKDSVFAQFGDNVIGNFSVDRPPVIGFEVVDGIVNQLGRTPAITSTVSPASIKQDHVDFNNYANERYEIQYNTQDKVMTYFMEAQSDGSRYYSFLFGSGYNTYGSSNYQWFFSLFNYAKQFAFVSGAFVDSPSFNTFKKAVVQIDHVAGTSTTFIDGIEISHTSASYSKYTPALQVGGFRSFASSYSGRIKMKHFGAFDYLVDKDVIDKYFETPGMVAFDTP